MTNILAEIRASNPVDAELLDTLELRSEYITGGVIRVVADEGDFVARLENNQLVKFDYCNLAVQRPEEGIARNQVLNFAIGNASAVASAEIRKVVNGNRQEPKPVYAVYRQYDRRSPNTVLERYEYEVQGYGINEQQVTFYAGFKEIVNRAAFRRYYTAKDHPGLIHI